MKKEKDLEPFSIHCETCAAKLKVARASAVGQKLACPKCGAMILVVAPDGWLPPSDKPTEPQASDSSESDFEDIDQILEQKSGVPNKPKQSQAKRVRAAKPVKPANSTVDTAPMLPNESWTSAGSQKKRTQLLIASGLIGLLIVGGAIALAVNTNRSPNTEQVADNTDEPVEPIDENDTTPSQAIDNSSNSDSSIAESTESETSPESSTDERASQHDKVGRTDSGDADPTSVTKKDKAQKEFVDDPLGSSENGDANESQPDKPAKPNIPSPFRSDLDDILQTSVDTVDDVKTNFDELAEALDSKGTSLFELNQFAILDSNAKRIGLPKYYISKPAEFDSSGFQNLSAPVLGVKLPDYTFLEFVAEITQITGVPISFNTDHSFFADFDFGFRIVDFEQTNSTFKGVMETALSNSDERLGIDLSDSSTARIGINGQSSIIDQRLPLPAETEKSVEQFLVMIQQLIAPGTWNGDKFVKAENNTLEIRHKSVVADQVTQLIRKWNVAKKVATGKLDQKSLENRWSKSTEARETKLDLNLPSDQPILDFFAAIQKSSGVNVLVDFSSLMGEGWNPKTTIPMDVSESTVGELVDEVAHSMNIGYRVVNPNTIEFTSKSRLRELMEVEFYFCKDLLSGSLNKDQLTEIVRQSLQSANRLDGSCRVYFDDEIESFIVVGEQNVQRLISSILNRLENL